MQVITSFLECLEFVQLRSLSFREFSFAGNFFRKLLEMNTDDDFASGIF